jgi:hypothetical protein
MMSAPLSAALPAATTLWRSLAVMVAHRLVIFNNYRTVLVGYFVQI